MYNSTIEYEEFKDKHSDNESNTENELYMSVCEEPESNMEYNTIEKTNSDTDYSEKELPETTVVKTSWMPNIDFYNSCDFGQPRPLNRYYDTQRLQDAQNSIDDVTDILRENMGRMLERSNTIQNIDQASENLLDGTIKFNKRARNLKYQMLSKYALHISALIIIVLFIVTLIVILVKS